MNTASSFCIIIGFIGSSEFRRNLYGCFWGLLRKKSLEEIFNEIWPMARNNNLQIESVYYKKLGKNLEGIG